MYRIVNSRFTNECINNTSTNAFFKKIQGLNHKDVDNLNEYLINYFYDNISTKKSATLLLTVHLWLFSMISNITTLW